MRGGSSAASGVRRAGARSASSTAARARSSVPSSASGASRTATTRSLAPVPSGTANPIVVEHVDVELGGHRDLPGGHAGHVLQHPADAEQRDRVGVRARAHLDVHGAHAATAVRRPGRAGPARPPREQAGARRRADGEHGVRGGARLARRAERGQPGRERRHHLAPGRAVEQRRRQQRGAPGARRRPAASTSSVATPGGPVHRQPPAQHVVAVRREARAAADQPVRRRRRRGVPAAHEAGSIRGTRTSTSRATGSGTPPRCSTPPDHGRRTVGHHRQPRAQPAGHRHRRARQHADRRAGQRDVHGVGAAVHDLERSVGRRGEQVRPPGATRRPGPRPAAGRGSCLPTLAAGRYVCRCEVVPNGPRRGVQVLPAGDPSAALARVDALHTALTAIVLEGGDLAGIAAEVARVLDLGVLVTSTDGRERAAHLAPGHRDLLDDAGLLDDTGRVRVERIDPAGTPVARRPGALAARRRRRRRPGADRRAAARPAGRRGRRARARARGHRRRAADHPRGGRHRRREQVPRRLPARRLPRPRRGPGVRRGSTRAPSAGTCAAPSSWSRPSSTRTRRARRRPRPGAGRSGSPPPGGR